MPVPPARHPTRAEFERLKTHCEELQAHIEALRVRLEDQAREIRTQFIRIAEMQAILDEERIANGKPRTTRPLLPADH